MKPPGTSVSVVLQATRGGLHRVFGDLPRSDGTLPESPGTGRMRRFLLRFGTRSHARCGILVAVVIDGVDMPEDSEPAVDHAGDLLVRIANGDQAAFAELYDMLSPRAFGLILRVLVDRAQCEEVLQEVFLEIWQSAGRFAPDKGQGRSWVLTIAHRRAVDRVRSAQASSDRDVRAGFREISTTPAGVAEEVELRIAGERVSEALSALPEPQREAIVLAYFGGYSQSEIAALVGAPLGTVKTRMRDGLSRLRTEMGVAT